MTVHAAKFFPQPSRVGDLCAMSNPTRNETATRAIRSGIITFVGGIAGALSQDPLVLNVAKWHQLDISGGTASLDELNRLVCGVRCSKSCPAVYKTASRC